MPAAETSLLSRAERSIYFRFARAVSWVLIVLATPVILIAVFSGFSLTKSALLDSSTSVTAEDLTRAIATRNAGALADEDAPRLDPAELAELDRAAYEIVALFPGVSQGNQEVDSYRGHIRQRVATITEEHSQQLAMLHELRDDLQELPEAQRVDATQHYFNLKSQRIQQQETKKTMAKAELALVTWVVMTGIALVMFGTMTLVLLSIERNTRNVDFHPLPSRALETLTHSPAMQSEPHPAAASPAGASVASRCPVCDAENAVAARFCRKCGRQFAAVASAP